MKRILVTGGAGFVGSHLIDRLLADGNEVMCLDSLSTGNIDNLDSARRTRRLDFALVDVCAPLPFEANEIFHLACPASPIAYQSDPVGTIRTCVQGTLNVLELARDTGARVLLASTSEIYGDPAEHPQRESYSGNVNPIGPRACYDEGKRCAEALAVSYARQYGVDVRIARIFNTYGPRMAFDDGRVVSNFIVQALKGEPLTVYGNGSQTRSFCYVTDTVHGLVRLMESDVDVPVNIGNPHEVTMQELASDVICMTRSTGGIEYKPLPTDDPHRRKPDITRARERLGWAPTVTLQDGLARTIEDFKRRMA